VCAAFVAPRAVLLLLFTIRGLCSEELCAALRVSFVLARARSGLDQGALSSAHTHKEALRELEDTIIAPTTATTATATAAGNATPSCAATAATTTTGGAKHLYNMLRED
jgi:hypothetical protein